MALGAAAGLRGLHGGALVNSAAAEALTSILIFINKTYAVDGAGVRITGERVPAHERVTAESAHMKQLSGLDYVFLQLERGNNFMHVAALGIYDPSSAPGGRVRFKDVLRFFSSRIARFPHFRRRLITVPWMLDRPYWVEDAELDVEFHVRHIALPQPGDWRQLCIQVARLHSRPLDRSKPLWEAYVIEGLHNVTACRRAASRCTRRCTTR